MQQAIGAIGRDVDQNPIAIMVIASLPPHLAHYGRA